MSSREGMLKRRTHESLFVSGLMIVLSISQALAHEEGAPFSAAVIDPLVVHHAHLEDEQRLNLTFSNGFKRADGKKRFAFMNEYELAFAQDFTWGGEIFIPFSTGGVGRDYGVGDIEIQPLKWAFINEPEMIATAALSFTLPTGSKKYGLGEGNTVFAPHLFFDRGFGNWFVGLNLSPNVNIGGKQGLSFEYKSVLSYSFIWETERVAPVVPKQDWVWIPSLEFLGESVIRGEDKEKTFISLLPGTTIWHTRSGWQVHTGVQIPTSKTREDNVRFLLQVGNHFDWAALGKAVRGNNSTQSKS